MECRSSDQRPFSKISHWSDQGSVILYNSQVFDEAIAGMPEWHYVRRFYQGDRVHLVRITGGENANKADDQNCQSSTDECAKEANDSPIQRQPHSWAEGHHCRRQWSISGWRMSTWLPISCWTETVIVSCMP
jgi:hypothetical protein